MDVFVPNIDCINAGITESCFPRSLKYAEVTPSHKKGDTTNKTNYTNKLTNTL